MNMTFCPSMKTTYSVSFNALVDLFVLTSLSITITFKSGKHLRKFRRAHTPARTQAVRLCQVIGSRRLDGP